MLPKTVFPFFPLETASVDISGEFFSLPQKLTVEPWLEPDIDQSH